MPDDSLTVVDNRTSKSYTLPIKHNTIRATDLRQIKTGPEDFGLMPYDPAFMNTASCESTITFIDGDKGILRYRGYPIEQLAEHCTYLEVAYLLIHGELPDREQLAGWEAGVKRHASIRENIKKFMEGFRYDAHPMGMLVSSIAAMSTIYPESRHIFDPEIRARQVRRLFAKVPIIAAYIYRLYQGYAFVPPDPDLSYTENFMNMLWRKSEGRFRPNPVLAHALDVLYILHADHEQNCSTSTMREVGSSHADPYVTAAAAAAALSGPLHGGANEEVLHMLAEIGSKDKIPAYIQRVKQGECKLMASATAFIRTTIRGPASASGSPTRSSRSPAATPRSISPSSWSASPSMTTTSSSASSIRTSTSTPGSSTRPWASGRDVHGAIRHRAHRGLAGAVGRAARRQGPEDRPPAPDLPGPRVPRFRAHGAARARQRRGGT